MIRIESPLIQELVAETRCKTWQRCILQVIEARFGSVPSNVASQIQAITDEHRLRDLHRQTVLCPDLDTFQQKLSS